MKADVLGDGLDCAVSGDSLDAVIRQITEVKVTLAIHHGTTDWRQISPELHAFDELILRQAGFIQSTRFDLTMSSTPASVR